MFHTALQLTDMMKAIDEATKSGEPAEAISKRLGIDPETLALVMQSRSLLNRLSDPSSD